MGPQLEPATAAPGAASSAGRTGEVGLKAGTARQRSFGLAAIVGGLVLIGLAAAMLWRQPATPAPYRYVTGEVVPPTELGALAELGGQTLTVRRASIVSDEHPTPLAELEFIESATTPAGADGAAAAPPGPILLDWKARVDDPFLTITTPPGDVAALAAVLQRHVGTDARLLAWWDLSRLFKRLAGVDVAFEQHLGVPLFLPAPWRNTDVSAVERAFWQAGEAEGRAPSKAQAAELERFERFASALTAPEGEGITALQALAAGSKTVLVLHLRDVVLLGQMMPDKLGVAFRDFGTMNDVHGMVRRVHGWLDEHKYPAYGVLQNPDRPLRAIALTDEASTRTLVARLLPFMGNDQRDVPGATLVYQLGGFSVFEIAPAAAPTARP